MADAVIREPLVVPWPPGSMSPSTAPAVAPAEESAEDVARLLARRAELARRTAAVEQARAEGRERPRST